MIHGELMSGRETPEYKCWRAIKQRCLNPKNANWSDYGGRGITVCDRWRNSFPNFLADVGRRPSPLHSIDRIDNDGNYEPGNIAWRMQREQHANRRCTSTITFNGETRSRRDWADHLGVSYDVLTDRIKRGWSVERMLMTPARSYGH